MKIFNYFQLNLSQFSLFLTRLLSIFFMIVKVQLCMQFPTSGTEMKKYIYIYIYIYICIYKYKSVYKINMRLHSFTHLVYGFRSFIYVRLGTELFIKHSTPSKDTGVLELIFFTKNSSFKN